MLRYELATEIHKPLDHVIRLFADRDLMPRWQPGLISQEQTESDPHPRYKLKFAFGRRKMDMTETVLKNELPDCYETQYQMKGVQNRIINRFSSGGPGVTKWELTTEYRFSGLMKIVAAFMKDGFKQQTVIIMNNFKRYAESNG